MQERAATNRTRGPVYGGIEHGQRTEGPWWKLADHAEDVQGAVCHVVPRLSVSLYIASKMATPARGWVAPYCSCHFIHGQRVTLLLHHASYRAHSTAGQSKRPPEEAMAT
mmetsp:Transcript_83762/g.194867  ORF Transcript_83762/g.194867 Transcript_83762/m.194867 type:complete len:110 (-) Transcript_83762:37-366(-)